MLYLRMYRGELPPSKLGRLGELKKVLGETLKPLLMPTLQTPASILGVGAENLRTSEETRREITRSAATVALDGELYTDGETVVAVAVHVPRPTHLLNRQRLLVASTQTGEPYRLEINAIGPRWECSVVAPVLSAVERILE